jgi:hypothetical protein
MDANPLRYKAFRVELRGLKPLTPTLPARVISQIRCCLVPPELTTSPASLGFMPSRATKCPTVPRDDH